MEWDPGRADTPVLSWHPEVLRDLCGTPDEIAILLALTLAEADMLRPEESSPGNFVLGLMLMPVSYLSAQEIHEAADRLAARGALAAVPQVPFPCVHVQREASRLTALGGSGARVRVVTAMLPSGCRACARHH